MIKKYALILLLWLTFCVGCALAPVAFLVLPLFPKRKRYLWNVLCAADRLMAAMFGFSGHHMLSTECAHATEYTWLRDLLNMIEPNHCAESAYNEGAYCRLSDRTIGRK
jgi:hypothetical protein